MPPAEIGRWARGGAPHGETLVPAPICHHGRIRLTTGQAIEFIDLTVRIEALVAEAGIHAGLVNVQSLHTTTAIVINEYEPLLLVDFGDLLARTAPTHAPYRHNRSECPEHPVAEGRTPERTCTLPGFAARLIRIAECRRRSPPAGPLAACLPGGTGWTARP